MNKKFPELKVGQSGRFNGHKITRVSRNRYVRNGISYTKSDLMNETLIHP